MIATVITCLGLAAASFVMGHWQVTIVFAVLAVASAVAGILVPKE